MLQFIFFIFFFCPWAYNYVGKLLRNGVLGYRVYAFSIVTLPNCPPKKAESIYNSINSVLLFEFVFFYWCS